MKENWPLVSIIILNYNGILFLNECLNSVLNSNYPNFEVILVDNASTDGSIESIEKLWKNYTSLKIVINKKNLGFPEGNNVGVRKSKGEYIVFLNNDTKVDQAWLEGMVRVMESDNEIAVCQSKLLSLDDNGLTIDSSGDFIDCYGVAISRGQGTTDLSQHNCIEEIFSARGASMMVRRRALEEVGLFDPDFFLQFEDIDLCWRMRLKGYKIMYVPDSIVYHKGLGTPSDFRSFHGQKNIIMMMLKNLAYANLILFFSTYMLYFFGGIFNDAVLRKEPRKILKKLQILTWLLSNMHCILNKRYEIQRKIRRVNDKKIKKVMLQTSFSLYTRYALELNRINSSNKKKDLSEWYYLMTKPTLVEEEQLSTCAH